MKNITSKILAIFIFAVYAMSAKAYDCIVIVENADNHQRIMDFIPKAFSPDDFSIIATSEAVPADSVFIFKNLPDEIALHLGVNVDGSRFSELVTEPRDTMIMPLPGFLFAKQLDEVVVQGDTRFITDEKTVYLPSKKEKKISAGGAELLNILAIPTIKVHPIDKTVQTVSGEQVTYFIDYMPASQQDVDNIRTMDVERVEVFDYPKDPIFMGAQHVVNYVLVKYEYGGYTKLNAKQRFVNNTGNYGVASKMTVKKMTYDVAGRFGYYSIDNCGSDTETLYKFKSGDLFRNQVLDASHIAERYGYATLRAVYRTDKSNISNTIGFSGRNSPDNVFNMHTSYTPQLYDTDKTENVTANSNFSLSWIGYYTWRFDNGYSLVVKPTASYSRYKSNSSYIYNTNDAVINNALDKGWDASIYAEGQKQIKRHSIGIALSTFFNGNDVDYTGTTLTTVNTNTVNSQLRFITNLNFDKFWAQGNFALRHQYNKINADHKNFVHPHIFVTAGYRINARQSVNMASEYAFGQVALSELSPVIIQTSNIDGVRGNPYLDRFISFNISAQYQYLFSNTLSAAVYGGYQRESSILTYVYSEQEGATGPLMVRDIINNGFANTLTYGVNMTAKLFNYSLMLQAGVNGNKRTRRGVININGDYLSFDVNAMYSYKSWYATAFYKYRSKSCMNWGYTETPEYYGLTIGWGNGDWDISGSAYNPFTKSKYSGQSTAYSTNYINHVVHYTDNYRYSFALNIVYSFSYGKKIQRGNEAGQINGVESAIMK